MMDWVLAEARRRGAEATLSLGLHRQSSAPSASTRATASRRSGATTSWSAPMPTRTSSCGWRCDASPIAMRRVADGPALADMGRRCFVETFGPHFPADDMALHLAAHVRAGGPARRAARPGLRVRMAEEDGEIAAYLKLAPMSLPVAARAGRARDQAALRARALAGRRRRGGADGLGDRDGARRRRAGAVSQRLGAWRPGHRLLRTPGLRDGRRGAVPARHADLSGSGDAARL